MNKGIVGRFAKPEMWPVGKIKPNPRNARVHPPEQIEELRASIRDFGWTAPILVDTDGLLIAGHGRLEAAKAEGYTQASVVVARGWTAAMKRRYALLDNIVPSRAQWDDEILKLELGELQSLGVDLLSTGFSGTELGDLGIAGFTLDEVTARAEETPEVPKTPVSRPGDLWICGEHRVLCGDSTNAEHVARLFGDAKPNLMVTDPPYGVQYDPAWRAEPGKLGAKDGSFLSTKGVRKGAVKNDERADWTPAWDLFPGSVAYVWHGGLFASVVERSLQASKFQTRAQIVWAKQHAPISRGAYHWRHECCWYVVRDGKTASWAGDRKQNTVWDIANRNAFGGKVDDETTQHGTQKPVECMKRPIINNSKKGDAVYDPFLGSGTTMIAAEMERRRCLGLELDPGYCDVIVERWQNFTGKKAALDNGKEDFGRTFAEVKAERIGKVAA